MPEINSLRDESSILISIYVYREYTVHNLTIYNYKDIECCHTYVATFNITRNILLA